MCRLYLDPPSDTVLFSVDDKTCHAGQVTHARHPADPTRLARAPGVRLTSATAPVPAANRDERHHRHRPTPRSSHATTRRPSSSSSTDLAQTVHPTKKIHLILDNNSTHPQLVA